MDSETPKTTPSIPKRPQRVKSKEISPLEPIDGDSTKESKPEPTIEDDSTVIPPIPRRPNKVNTTAELDSKSEESLSTSKEIIDNEIGRETSPPAASRSPIKEIPSNEGSDDGSSYASPSDIGETENIEGNNQSQSESPQLLQQLESKLSIVTQESGKPDSSSVPKNTEDVDTKKGSFTSRVNSDSNEANRGKSSSQYVKESSEFLKDVESDFDKKGSEESTTTPENKTSENVETLDKNILSSSKEENVNTAESSSSAKLNTIDKSSQQNSHITGEPSSDITKEIPAIPKRPTKTSDSSSTISNTSKVPPAKPKKLSSKIAAFQQLLNESVTNESSEHQEKQKNTSGAIGTFRQTASKLSTDKMQFAQNLQGMMQKNIASSTTPKTESQPGASPTEGTSSNIPESRLSRPRAKGPKGKRLPKALKEPEPIVSEPKFSLFFTDLYSVDVRTKGKSSYESPTSEVNTEHAYESADSADNAGGADDVDGVDGANSFQNNYDTGTSYERKADEEKDEEDRVDNVIDSVSSNISSPVDNTEDGASKEESVEENEGQAANESNLFSAQDEK